MKSERGCSFLSPPRDYGYEILINIKEVKRVNYVLKQVYKIVKKYKFEES